MPDDAGPTPAPDSETADELGARLIDEVQAAGASRPGRRVLHARGIGAAGLFVANGDAAALTRAAHLQPGAVTPVVVRFSNGSADPDVRDGARDGRGMATKFRLADGIVDRLVALSLPMFFVRTTDDFIELRAGPPTRPGDRRDGPERLLDFLGAHPEAQAAAELSIAAPAPVGYDRQRYHSVHVFWLVDGDGTAARCATAGSRWRASSGLTDEEAAGRPADFLRPGLPPGLAAGPVGFDLEIVVGREPVTRPTMRHRCGPTDATSWWPVGSI